MCSLTYTWPTVQELHGWVSLLSYHYRRSWPLLWLVCHGEWRQWPSASLWQHSIHSNRFERFIFVRTIHCLGTPQHRIVLFLRPIWTSHCVLLLSVCSFLGQGR